MQNSKFFPVVLAVAFVLGGCGHLKTVSDLKRARAAAARAEGPVVELKKNTAPKPASVGEVTSQDIPPITVEADETEANEVLETKTAEESSAPAEIEADLRIPVEMNEHVERWIQYFTVKDRERFQRFLDRGELYREVVASVLEENDLPAELFYLAMIESGFQTHARSHAKAVGVWQFIAGTGSRYGLRIDSQVDERKDPIRATEAAAKYLRDLYNVFGSWHLALSAYNAGEIRILRAVMKARTRDFWELHNARVLPRETANYVPKFLAVVLIGKEPEKYGFTLRESDDAYPNLEAVAVPGGVTLNKIAALSGISATLLKRVNPHLRRARTPVGSSSYEIWVPSGRGAKVARLNKELKRYAIHRRERRSRRSPAGIHIVRRGENLSTIARKYKVSVGHLMRINGMKSTRLLAGTKLRTQAKAYRSSRTVRYRVRRGDNLTIIARKFNTSPSRIRARNKLSRNLIFAGQVLKID